LRDLESSSECKVFRQKHPDRNYALKVILNLFQNLIYSMGYAPMSLRLHSTGKGSSVRNSTKCKKFEGIWSNFITENEFRITVFANKKG